MPAEIERRHRSIHAVQFLLFFSIMAASGYPLCACVSFNEQATGVGVGSFDLSSTSVSSTTLGLAGSMWNECPGSGSTIPSIKIDGSGDLPVTVQLVQGKCTVSPSCGCGSIARQKNSSGELIGATITLYTETATGTACDSSSRHVTLAHELGHAYGLANSSCSEYIMSPLSPTRTVKTDECAGADDRWLTPTETEDVTEDEEDHPCSAQTK